MSEYNEGNENIEPPVKETKEIEIWDDAVFPTYSDNDLGSSTNATPTEMLQSDSDEEFKEQTVVSEEEKVREYAEQQAKAKAEDEAEYAEQQAKAKAEAEAAEAEEARKAEERAALEADVQAKGVALNKEYIDLMDKKNAAFESTIDATNVEDRERFANLQYELGEQMEQVRSRIIENNNRLK